MRIEICVSIGFVGCNKIDEIYIDDEDLENMTEEEKEKRIDEEVLDHILGMMINWTWKELE